MDPLASQFMLFLTTNIATWKVVLIVVLVALSAFFSGTETALTNCSETYIKAKYDEGRKSAKLVKKVKDNYDHSLATILVGNNVVNNVASNIATSIAVVLCANIAFAGSNDFLASMLATAVMTIVIFVFGELLPKNICKAQANRLSQVLVYPLMFLNILLYPVSYVFSLLLKLVNKVNTESDDNEFDEEDFQSKVDELEQQGELDNDESEIIQNAVDFNDITVTSVMTKIENVEAINIKGLNKSQVLKQVCQLNRSRIPVYIDNINNVQGVIHTRKLLRTALSSRNYSVKSVMSEAVFVNDDILLDDMVEIFKQRKVHMAFVQDKDKDIIGIVTMDDVLDELMKDINEGGENNDSRS